MMVVMIIMVDIIEAVTCLMVVYVIMVGTGLVLMVIEGSNGHGYNIITQ